MDGPNGGGHGRDRDNHNRPWTVIAAIRKTKTALGALPTGTIATGITAVLVSIKGRRYILSNDI